MNVGTLTCHVPADKSPPLSGPQCPREDGRGQCGFPTPWPSRQDHPSPLPLTTDTASSKPSALQLMTRARTPSRQTLGEKKATQQPQAKGDSHATCQDAGHRTRSQGDLGIRRGQSEPRRAQYK